MRRTKLAVSAAATWDLADPSGDSGTTKAGNYRLVVAETSSVWAAYSTTVAGRM
jgi:hypothetical protein